MMKAARTKRSLLAAVLVSGLLLVSTAPPAIGLRFSQYPGCGELCSRKFWPGASAKDVDAGLGKRPSARAYLRRMLRLAVKAGNAEATAALLRAGAPPNVREKEDEYDYMLHVAARRGRQLVSVLLRGGALPGVVNKEGRTPLHVAVMSGQPAAAALLIEAGADPRAPDDEGLTAVNLAQRRSEHENWFWLSKWRRPPPCGRLCDAAFWKNTTIDQVRSALAQAPAGTRRSAPGGGPLHLALAAGADVEDVKLLLDHGMNPNGRDLRDDTPLHVAARTPGGAGSVRLLLGRGAMRDAPNAKGWTPLHAASERGATIEAMRVLLDAGADPAIRGGDTFFRVTPREFAVSQPEGPKGAQLILDYPGRSQSLSSLLNAAAGRGHPDTIEYLLSEGANAHNPDRYFGKTALHAAASYGNTATMRVLLRHGAKPGYSKYDHGPAVLSGEGERPLHRAIRHPAAVKLLLESGADPDGKTLERETPLHRAARTCAGESLALLLAHGADPNVRDRYGDTPLHEAVRRLSDSRNSERIKRRWLASCKRKKKENEPGWEGCRARVIEDFKRRFETRGECETNIATLLRFGADPGIGADFGDNKNVSPLDMAKKRGLGDSIIGMMEEALRKNNR